MPCERVERAEAHPDDLVPLTGVATAVGFHTQTFRMLTRLDLIKCNRCTPKPPSPPPKKY